MQIDDLNTTTSGMSCNGLSIIFNTDNIVCISTVSKYVPDVSLNTGSSKSDISFSYIGDKFDVALSKITISFGLIFL